MSRSKRQQKPKPMGCGTCFSEVGCFCKPRESVAVLRATVDDPRAIAVEEDPQEWHDDFCEWCDAMVDQGELSAHHLRCPRVGEPCTYRDPLAHRIPLSRAS